MTQFTSFFIIIALILYIIVLKRRLARANQKMAVQPDKKLDQEVAAMLQRGKKTVRAIKYVRDQTGLGLLEAKQYVDRVQSNLHC
ncbi:ribosomal protein L7/L12 [Domibacillus iocasae]|uniref:Large ribosomal subunit protein bL12 C-terminal domain-containing protein n=1 Tax=Domibacillus iocasae TaxID=1714016 RepID=A0A1E7DK47_9BACI|nr:ribosomal protein L7/L12 [Domibacillus iocasae]OES43456.1 hypothetical protein BA724_13620 [Domibacillus iocasae]